MFDFLQSISAKNPNAGRGPEKPAVSVRPNILRTEPNPPPIKKALTAR
jgi:ATP-binding cassette subfamily B protein